ncbi:hypothetical protein PQO01_02510 [Lentisphaera marina]|uniref:hypothetical protein n=1 Tax=Lentisphaera marina TaxID=1111041 RepID=UPI002366CF54|nr:hypothetical protein [Lentisphaera marina]MDD7983819.1 hypothetical protein [Lentisphaera marina]
MKISLTDVDSLLENQSLLQLDLIPGKNLQWNTFLNFRGGKLGNIYYTVNEIDAVANLNSQDYQLCIPLNTNGDKYRLNGTEASKMFLITPTASTSVCFPRKFDELHFVFKVETFAMMAKKNEAYELLLKDKVFLYHQYDLKFWSETVHSVLSDPSTCVDQALKKFMDTFFQVHSISGNSESPALMKSFFCKRSIPLSQRKYIFRPRSYRYVSKV